MTPERIITAATVTSGEKHDGKELQSLVDKMESNGVDVEAKNAELKNQHGYAHSSYSGLHGMTLQAGVSIFVVNLKRILRLKNGKEGK